MPYEEPRRLLEEEVGKRQIGDRVFALRTGERLVLPDTAAGKAPWVSSRLPPGVAPPEKVAPPPAVPAKPSGSSAGMEKTERPAPAE